MTRKMLVMSLGKEGMGGGRSCWEAGGVGERREGGIEGKGMKIGKDIIFCYFYLRRVKKRKDI